MVGQPRPPFPSAHSEPSLRRLGTGNSPNSDRPIRAQLVVALVSLIILLAVPLYLWRRPSVHMVAHDAGVPAATVLVTPPVPLPSAVQLGFQPEAVRTGALQRVRCGSNRQHATNNIACDALPAVERALVEAIQKTPDCAPKTAKEGTINFVLEVDFAHKTLHVFPGRSGEWHGPSARRATKCVEHAIGKPDLTAITHNYAYYALAVMATYPAGGDTNAAIARPPLPAAILSTIPMVEAAPTASMPVQAPPASSFK